MRVNCVSRQDDLSVSRQCALLGLNRTGLYYEPASASALTLGLMRVIDELFTGVPFFGSRRLTAGLKRAGYRVNRKRVRRLMALMGLEAIYPKRKTSATNSAHKKYAYLLSDFVVQRPNQVWATDITYIRMRTGYLYLVAIMDWYSRYVLSWRLSNTMEVSFCIEALESALGQGRPEIFNSDQGSQFTSDEFTRLLKGAEIRISMDGKGRAFDNIFVERLWRSVKYEEVYLKDYETVPDARDGLGQYFDFYNIERPHQALGYRTPAEVHFDRGENPTLN